MITYVIEYRKMDIENGEWVNYTVECESIDSLLSVVSVMALSIRELTMVIKSIHVK